MTREQAIELARRCAQAKPPSYYAEPFEPHEWVVDAILEAGAETQRLLAELATHYPIAIAARAWANEEASEDDVRDVIDATMNATPPERIAALPRHIADGRQ